MNTQRKTGTHVNPFLHGVDRFLRERGLREYSLRFQGYREHERRYSAGSHAPRIAWIQSALARGGCVWLLVGWYDHDAGENEYHRVGGHWVTAIGYGVGRDGTRDARIIVIHDPSAAAGRYPAREFVRLARLADGTLVGARSGHTCPARGIFRMEGEMHVKRGVDLALLDGAVALVLPP